MWPSSSPSKPQKVASPSPPTESSCSSDEGSGDQNSQHEAQPSETAPPPHSDIQRLAQDTIRRISAEQAISDLSSIVKELVDNALDAEATTIKSA